MKKALRSWLTLLVFAALTSNAQAQFPAIVFPLPADNPVWKYGELETFVGWWGINIVTYADTVSHCGQEYGRLMENWYHTLFVRVNGDTVWVREDSTCARPEFIAMDFGAEVGDTLWLAHDLIASAATNPLAPFIVSERDTVLHKGYFRRRLKLLYDGCYFGPPVNWQNVVFETEWIEGIGITTPFPLLFAKTACDLNEIWYCFHSLTEGTDTLWYTGCATNVGQSDARPTSLSLRAYPNPAGENATLEIETKHPGPAEVVLTNSLGQRVWAGHITLTAGRNALPLALPAAGVYAVTVQMDGQSEASLRVVAIR